MTRNRPSLARRGAIALVFIAAAHCFPHADEERAGANEATVGAIEATAGAAGSTDTTVGATEEAAGANESGTSASADEPGKATIVKQWKGRRPLGSEPLNPSFVTDAETLAKVWEDWGVPDPIPSIDFEKEIVLTLIVRSSTVMFIRPAIHDGDLRRNGVATPDYPAYWSYAICLVKRDDIRSVDGETL
jgi:hypothetical protein